MSQGNRKHLIHLACFRDRVKTVPDMAQNRCDLKPGDRFMAWQGAHHLDAAARQADLFLCLAQGGGGRHLRLQDRPCRRERRSGPGGVSAPMIAWSGSPAPRRLSVGWAPELPRGAEYARAAERHPGSDRNPRTRHSFGQAPQSAGKGDQTLPPSASAASLPNASGVELVMRTAKLAVSRNDALIRDHIGDILGRIHRKRFDHAVC